MKKRLFGVTTLDVVRAKTSYAGRANLNVVGMAGVLFLETSSCSLW